MVLENYVTLQPGVPAKVHFYDHRIESRTITDARTGQPVIRNVLIFDVDRLNDQPCAARYSTMSEKHAQQFSPYLETKLYKDYDFTITVNGDGYLRSWSLQVTPRP